jgi:probable addiction module antidote protein
MAKVKVSRFDASDYLDSAEAAAAYLNAALDEGDPDLLMAAIADVAKARGIAQVAADAALGRESLYKTLKPGSKPQIGTVFRLLHALGIKLSAAPEAAVSRRVEPRPSPRNGTLVSS